MADTVSDDFGIDASCGFGASLVVTTLALGLLAGLSHLIGIPVLVFSLTTTAGGAESITFAEGGLVAVVVP